MDSTLTSPWCNWIRTCKVKILKPISSQHFPSIASCSLCLHFLSSFFIYFFHPMRGRDFPFLLEGGRWKIQRGEGGGKSVTSYFAYYTKHISLYYVLCFPSDYLGGSWVFFLYQELIYRMLLSLILHHSDVCSEWWFMLNGVDVTVVSLLSFILVSAKSEWDFKRTETLR